MAALRSFVQPASQLQSEILTIQQQIDAMNRVLKTSNELMMSASKVSTAELKKQMQQLQSDNSRLVVELASLEGEMRRWAQLEPEAARTQQELADLRQQIDQVRSTKQELTQEIDRIRRDERSIFTLPRGMNRAGWLVDVSEHQIQVAPLGRVGRPVTFVEDATGLFTRAAATKKFINWLKAHPSSDAFYFLFVRPDGAQAFKEIAELFDNRRISYGFDLAGLNETLLHPDRGAGE